MATNPEIVGALPANGQADHSLLRAAIMRRTSYVMADDEDSRDLICLDGGTKILSLTFKGRLYAFDPLDDITDHDGASCLVSNDGFRYKLNDLQVPDSVLDKDLTEPPEDAAIGDAYILLNAGSGAWADPTFISKILVLTARGWEKISPRIGRRFYVEDEDSFYYLNANGDWVAGNGAVVLQDNSTSIAKLIGGGGNIRWRIINQTTNNPPGAPTKGDAYIGGAAPTGAWAGGAKKIWVWEGTSWRSFTPQVGWRAYDVAKNVDYQFDGATWNAANGIIASALLSIGGFGANIAGFVNAANAATDVLTHSVAHGLVTGDIIKFSESGAIPGGLTTSIPYYVNALSATTFAVYALKSDSLADINRMNITSNVGFINALAIAKMVGITVDKSFGFSAANFEIMASMPGSVSCVFTSAEPDKNYLALPASAFLDTLAHDYFSPFQPDSKNTNYCIYQAGMREGATKFKWADLTSAQTLKLNILIMR